MLTFRRQEATEEASFALYRQHREERQKLSALKREIVWGRMKRKNYRLTKMSFALMGLHIKGLDITSETRRKKGGNT